jgi:type I restriction enzyme S subunit
MTTNNGQMRFAFPMVQLGEIVRPAERFESPQPGRPYRQIGVRLWGQGAYERETVDGAGTKYSKLNRVETGDIIVNKIWARNGSVTVVPNQLAGCFCSGEFPLFQPTNGELLPAWFFWLTKTRWFWDQCDKQSRGTSGKNRIRPEMFLAIEIPLPPLEEQRRIVARIDRLAAKIDEAQEATQRVESEWLTLLRSRFSQIVDGAPRDKMENVAPLIRRKVEPRLGEEYPELGIRSFGKGTFHKPSLDYLNVGTKKLYRIEPGDLVFNNVFAWEGAIAVSQPEDEGRVGSHRFITCVPQDGVVTADFLCFYFLTPEGLERVREASPGGAGRNRTLGLEKLAQIEVPIPAYESQVSFGRLIQKVRAMQTVRDTVRNETNAMLPSILDRAFKGAL